MPGTSSDTWRWGNELVACFDELKPELGIFQPAVIDREIIPDFSGSPDGLVLWLICAKERGVATLEAEAPHFRSLFAAAMTRRQFPQSAIDSLWLGFTSHEQINKGGGRFGYFR
jgi:hypothetical protein